MSPDPLPDPLGAAPLARPSSDRALRLVGLVAVAGIGAGVATQVGQSVLPNGWSQAANAISTWLLVAFLLGSRIPERRWAAVAGIAAVFLAVVGYYTTIELRYGYGGGTGSWVLWGLSSLLGGSVFGVAGWSWRFEVGWRGAAAVGLLAAGAIAEGIYLIWTLPDVAVGVGFVIAGTLVPLVLTQSASDRRRAYLAIVPAMALGALGYAAFLALASMTAGL